MIKFNLRTSITTVNKYNSFSFALIFVLLNFISAFIAEYPLFQQSGWPANHEGTAFATRTIYYANAIKAGDLIPIWTPEENHGLGSPMPLFYPRLFNIVSGSILLMTGLIKFSLCMTFILFSIGGAYGIFMICRELTIPRWQALIFSLAFPHLNYVYVDFITRGAMAEYAAMCILPFLTWWSLRLIIRQELNLSIAGLLVLCSVAHAGIAMVATFMLTFAVIIAFIAYPNKRKKIFYKLTISSLLFAIFAIPYALLLLSFKKYFNFFMYKIYVPWDFYLPWQRYFLDDALSKKSSAGLSPQLDFMFLYGTLLLIVAFIIFNITKYREQKAIRIPSQDINCIIFIFCSLLFYFGLQFPFSTWFYQYIPGMDALQFPFRLLSFISILLVTAYISLLQLFNSNISRKTFWCLVLIPCAGTFIINVSKTTPIEWIDKHKLENPTSGNWQEYTPVAPSNVRAFSAWMKHIAKLPIIVHSGKPDFLSVQQSATGKFMTVNITSKNPIEITLPAIWSINYLIIIERYEKTYKLPSFRRGFDPRICIKIPPGENKITIKYPSLSTMCQQFFYSWLPSTTNPDNTSNNLPKI